MRFMMEADVVNDIHTSSAGVQTSRLLPVTIEKGSMGFLYLSLLALLFVRAQGFECVLQENDGNITTCTTHTGCVLFVGVVSYDSEPHIARHCLSAGLTFCHRLALDNRDNYLHQFSGCCMEEFCNRFFNTSMLPEEYYAYVERRDEWLRNSNPSSTTPDNTVVIATVVPIVGSILTMILVGFTIVIVTYFFVRRNRPKSDEVEDMRISALELSSGRGNGHLLENRTISKEIQLIEEIGRGRYGEVWLGKWRDKEVAVKKFAFCDKESWKREKEIYETALLRNDHILNYLAADKYEHGYSTCLEMWMVTDYHPHGSLFDYLNLHTLTQFEMIKFSKTIASGLSFLHAELRTRDSLKPSIAHRDIKSRNILIQSNKTCCIADFGLAVRHDTVKNMIDIAPNSKQGTKRYMSPEVLNETIDINVFASFKQSDMYSFGLVLWEMLRRCIVNGECEEYQLPYYDKVPGDPSIKEMKTLVVDQVYRPEIKHKWLKGDEALSTMADLMEECWHPIPEARLTARRVMKNLEAVPVKETQTS